MNPQYPKKGRLVGHKAQQKPCTSKHTEQQTQIAGHDQQDYSAHASLAASTLAWKDPTQTQCEQDQSKHEWDHGQDSPLYPRQKAVNPSNLSWPKRQIPPKQPEPIPDQTEGRITPLRPIKHTQDSTSTGQRLPPEPEPDCTKNSSTQREKDKRESFSSMQGTWN